MLQTTKLDADTWRVFEEGEPDKTSLSVFSIIDLLRTPSSFEDQPVAFARNQAGHAGVGMFLAWALGAWWPVAVGYAVWEVIQWRRFGGDDWDGLQDWAFVVTGAFAAVNLWLLVPMAGYLGAGYLRRADG